MKLLVCPFGNSHDGPHGDSILYIWCQTNEESIVHFLFGTQLPAVYLPLVLFGLKFIIFREIFCWKENTTNIFIPSQVMEFCNSVES